MRTYFNREVTQEIADRFSLVTSKLNGIYFTALLDEDGRMYLTDRFDPRIAAQMRFLKSQGGLLS
jgi:hypothetical protein